MSEVFDRDFPGGQPIPEYPQGSAAEIALSPFGSTLVADGVKLVGANPSHRNITVHDWRGFGIKPFEGAGRVIDSSVFRCHSGILMPPSDMEVRGNQVNRIRDACLWLPKDSGNCKSIQNHYHGAQVPCFNEGAYPFRSTLDDFSDGWCGYIALGASNKSKFHNCFFQHNSVRDLYFANSAGDAELTGCTIDIMRDVLTYNEFMLPAPWNLTLKRKVGVEMCGDRGAIYGGSLELLPYWHPAHTPSGFPAECLWVDGHSCKAFTYMGNYQGVDGAVGVRLSPTVTDFQCDIDIENFDAPKDRVLIVDSLAGGLNACRALDMTFRIAKSPTKPWNDYVDIGAGWTGVIRLINKRTGGMQVLQSGSPY